MAIWTRRQFLATAAAGAALGSWTVASPKVSGQVLGANDAIRVGVVGLRGRGQTHVAMVSKIPGFRLVALCDADAAVLGGAAEKGGGRQGGCRRRDRPRRPPTVGTQGYRRRHHRHAQPLAFLDRVWACQAGKDVYVEKPVSHDVWEGRNWSTPRGSTIAWSRPAPGPRQPRRDRSGRLDPGRQSRQDPLRPGHLLQAADVDRQVWQRGNPARPGLQPLDWPGPAQGRWPARTSIMTGTGFTTTATATWATKGSTRWIWPGGLLGYTTLSPHVISIGGRFGYDDDGQTPNTQLVYHDFGGPPVGVRGPRPAQFSRAPTRRHLGAEHGRDRRPEPRRRDRRCGRVRSGQMRGDQRWRDGCCRGSPREGGAAVRHDSSAIRPRVVQGRPLHFRQLAASDPLPQPGRSQSRDPRRPSLQRPVPHGHDLAPHRPGNARGPDSRAHSIEPAGSRVAFARCKNTWAATAST